MKIPSDLKGITITRFQDNRGLSLGAKEAVKEVSKLIRKRGRRQFRYLLAKSWGYDEKAFDFSMRLDAVKLESRKERLHNKQFVLVARKHDEHEAFETDTRITIGDPISVPAHSSNDLYVALKSPRGFRDIKDEDRIDGQLVVIPRGLSIADCNTLAEVVSRGGELLDCVGVTARF